MVDMDLFKHRSFAVSMPLVILYYVGASGLFFTFVLFLHSGLGFSPVDSGLAFAAINTGFITASLLGPRLIPRFGNRLLSIAYALEAAGLIWTMLTVTSSGTALTLYELAAPLIVFGLGAGFALSPLLGIILSGVPSQDVGAASGVVSTSMQIGNTVGISLFGLLFYRFLSSQLSSAPISYLDSFKLTLPFLIIPAISSFIIASSSHNDVRGRSSTALKRDQLGKPGPKANQSMAATHQNRNTSPNSGDLITISISDLRKIRG